MIFVITGFEIGSGKFKNTLGAIHVIGNVDGKVIRAKVGSGFSEEEREDVWSRREELMDTYIEVKYQGVTDKPNANGEYSIRFPVFMKYKEDR